MEITVRYHGIVGDMLERTTEQVALPDGASVGDLYKLLSSQDETTAAILKQTRPFINGQQAERGSELRDGVEVLFMRPIVGG